MIFLKSHYIITNNVAFVWTGTQLIQHHKCHTVGRVLLPDILAVSRPRGWLLYRRLNPVVPWAECATAVGDTLVHHTVLTRGRRRTLLLGNGRPSWAC